MKKNSGRSHAGRPKKKTKLAEINFDDDAIDNLENSDTTGEFEWILPPTNFQSLAARRKLEARLDELALRRALEDFPDDRILN